MSKKKGKKPKHLNALAPKPSPWPSTRMPEIVTLLEHLVDGPRRPDPKYVPAAKELAVMLIQAALEGEFEMLKSMCDFGAPGRPRTFETCLRELELVDVYLLACAAGRADPCMETARIKFPDATTARELEAARKKVERAVDKWDGTEEFFRCDADVKRWLAERADTK